MVKYFKNNFLESSIKILFLNLFLLPIYPDNFKPTVVGLFCLFSILFFIIKDLSFKVEKKKIIHLLIINSLPFLVILITLFYTDNINYGLVLLFRILPLILFPLAFYLLKSNKILFTNKILTLAKLFFYFSVLFLFISICIYFFFKGFVTKNFFLNYSYRIIYQIGYYSIHPIYASIYTSIALLFSISLFKIKKYKLFILVGNILLIINLLLLSRKSAIFMMTVMFLVYLIYNHKINFKTKIIAFICLITIGFSIYKFVPDISNRFKDLVGFMQKDNHKSSSNLRLNIYKTSVSLLKEKPLFGYGIGSGEEVLFQKEKLNNYFKGKHYNSHNQYLAYLLNTGVFGLLVFLFSIFKNIKLAFLNSFEHLSLLFFFMFLMFIENILDRQNGVIMFSLFINYFAFFAVLNSKYE